MKKIPYYLISLALIAAVFYNKITEWLSNLDVPLIPYVAGLLLALVPLGTCSLRIISIYNSDDSTNEADVPECIVMGSVYVLSMGGCVFHWITHVDNKPSTNVLYVILLWLFPAAVTLGLRKWLKKKYGEQEPLDPYRQMYE